MMIPTPPTTDSVALYHCEEGYILVGDERRICFSNQTWSGKEPTCGKDMHVYSFSSCNNSNGL